MKKLFKVDVPKLPDEFFLCWYGIEDENIYGEEHITKTEGLLELLKEIFTLEDGDVVDSYLIDEDQVEYIQPFVKHKIDTDKHDYVIEHLT